jgi:hypothetical protein
LPEDLKQRGGLIYEDDECWVFKEVEKGRKLASKGQSIFLLVSQVVSDLAAVAGDLRRIKEAERADRRPERDRLFRLLPVS